MLGRDDIVKLIEGGENSFVEFKREEEKTDDFIKAIAAFANVKGGYLLIGVADDGSVRGVQQPKQLEERLMNACTDSLKPIIIPDITLFSEKDKINFLINKELLVYYEDQVKPTLAGLLLFGRNPGRFLFFSGITLTRFKGEKGTTNTKIIK